MSFDSRQDILEIRTTAEGQIIVCTRKALAEELQATLPTPLPILLLPDPALGANTRALITVSVAAVRKAPAHAAELLCQGLMGQEVTLLEKATPNWYRICNWDTYIGYIHADHITHTQPGQNNGYFTLDKYAVFANYAQALAEPDPDSEPVFDVSAGCILGAGAITAHSGTLYRTVYTPDMRQGFLPSADLLPKPPEHFAPADLLPWAIRWLGTPYLWGGNTPRGLDCSGMLQLAGWLCKQSFMRDASQQATMGQLMEEKKWQSLVAGDLLFFGDEPGRITHVALYEGEGTYIHASGYVRRNSLRPEDSTYEPYRCQTWQHTRRLS